MPDQFLGYWKPRSKTLAGVGLDIQPGIFYYKDDPEYYKDLDPDELGIRDYTQYKVLDYDDSRVYLLTKERITKEWAEEMLKIPYEESVKKGYVDPDYAYTILFIREHDYSPDYRTLGMDGYRCGLTEKDWNLPLHIHQERLRTKYCETRPDAQYDSIGGSFWGRFENDTAP